VNRILLVRHGENKANLTKEFSHRLVDYPLTAKGRLQAEQTAAYLSAYPVTQLFTSPLRRARETAQIIAAGVDVTVTVLEGFRELNVGTLEAQPPNAATWRLHDDIVRAWATGDADARFPEGENFTELVDRVRRGYETMCRGRDGETLVLVAHGGSLGLPLLSLVPNLDRELLRPTHHNCAVGELNALLDGDILHLSLVRWASSAHLHGDDAVFVAGSPDEGELD
jgi:broad specificity phosphatase PhoE